MSDQHNEPDDFKKFTDIIRSVSLLDRVIAAGDSLIEELGKQSSDLVVLQGDLALAYGQFRFLTELLMEIGDESEYRIRLNQPAEYVRMTHNFLLNTTLAMSRGSYTVVDRSLVLLAVPAILAYLRSQDLDHIQLALPPVDPAADPLAGNTSSFKPPLPRRPPGDPMISIDLPDETVPSEPIRVVGPASADPVPDVGLTRDDICDRCPAQAMRRVNIPGIGEFLFCQHHHDNFTNPRTATEDPTN